MKHFKNVEASQTNMTKSKVTNDNFSKTSKKGVGLPREDVSLDENYRVLERTLTR